MTRRAIAVGQVVISAIVLVACLDLPGPDSGQGPVQILAPTGRAQRPSVSAAVHLHGWSNHGGNRRPASIAWHTQQYASAGVELLWWTDHHDVFVGRVPDLVITPRTPTRIMADLWSIGSWGPGGYGTAFLRSASAPVVDSATNRITVPILAGDSTQSDTVELFFGLLRNGRPARASYGVLSRPLVGQPRLSFNLWPIGSGRFPSVRIQIPLAWHPRGDAGFRQVLDYQFGSGDEPQTVVHHDTLSRYIQSSLADSTTIEIDPATDATAFTNGIDNTTDEYRIGLVARRGSGGRNLSFELPRIVNAAMGAETQMTPARQLSHAMADAYGVRAFWGLEIGSLGPIAGTKWASAAGAGSHLALFLPGDVLGSMESAMKGPPAAYSNLAASYGGITAIAHPFGVSGLVPTKSDEAQFADAEELGSYLVANGGWGASLIEVGLVRRGEVSLRTHMYLHDYLWASGVRLCGIGVSDSHGGHVLKDPPLDNVEANNFVTWIGGVDAGSSGAEFIAQMKACNLSFGNPYYVRGGMWISAEPDSVAYRVAFDVDGVTPSAQFYLTEVGIDSSGTGHAPMYYKIGELTARTGGTQVGRCTPVFIRLEAWSAGRPIAFSNVVLLPGVARLCVSGARQN